MLMCLCPAPGVHAATIDIFVCNEGQLARQTVEPSQVAGHETWLRQGNAIWTNGRIDQSTSSAIGESRGIWGILALKDLFAWFGTVTQPDVLASIAMAESGRNGRPWPWTINFQGKSYYYPTKDQAVTAAQQIIDQGYTSFDIGLMQVNWRFHADKLNSLEQGFDPFHNVRVADAIVQAHLKETGSLMEAVGRYHSKTPSLKSTYLGKISDRYSGIFKTTTSLSIGNQLCG